MRGKQILARAFEIQNENWGITTRFFLNIIKQQSVFQKNSKYKGKYGVFFFQIEALLTLQNAWLQQIFFLETKSTCVLSSSFST